MERIAHKCTSFEEAAEWDIRQQVAMTARERFKGAVFLRNRAFPPPNRDIRECHKRS